MREQLRRGEPYGKALRRDWESFDPQLMAEASFATANIFSILKLIHFCTINPHLGPLQLTLGRMVNDVLRFMTLALLVCFAFSCGVNQLYWHYSAQEISECETQCNDTLVENCICDRSLAKYVINIVRIHYQNLQGGAKNGANGPSYLIANILKTP